MLPMRWLWGPRVHSVRATGIEAMFLYPSDVNWVRVVGLVLFMTWLEQCLVLSEYLINVTYN